MVGAPDMERNIVIDYPAPDEEVVKHPKWGLNIDQEPIHQNWHASMVKFTTGFALSPMVHGMNPGPST